ncbi:MAG: SMC-Scp complex subunit ScpB [Phycisphaerae bacterium]|nr:SMC-Scp complex subunit ScpB [Phycisphaerae bacterium]
MEAQELQVALETVEKGQDALEQPENEVVDTEVEPASSANSPELTGEVEPEQDNQADLESKSDAEKVEVEELPDELEEGITISSVVEAVLFAADEAVPARKLVEILGVGDVRKVKQCIANLNEEYEKSGRVFRVEQIAGGYQLLTLSAYNPWLSKLVKVRSETKLTPAGMETLAIIAYKQPIMRVDIERIRGVAAGEMIRQLVDKGMVKITGRAEELGRPLLYGTTRKFLEIFGLNSIKDLPKPEEDKKKKV